MDRREFLKQVTLWSAGASMVLVFDRTCNEERRCYQNSGMAPALEKIKDKHFRLDYMNDRKFVPVTLKNGPQCWDPADGSGPMPNPLA